MKWVKRLFFLCFYSCLLYGTAYWFTLSPEKAHFDTQPPLIGKKATYAIGGEWAEKAFGPAHWIDRQVRPEFWGFALANLRQR